MKNYHVPRPPNAEEAQQLVTYYLRQVYGKRPRAEQRQAAQETVSTAWIAVFDDYYQAAATNQQGKLIFVNWDVDGCNYEVFAWTAQGQLESIRQDTRDYQVI